MTGFPKIPFQNNRDAQSQEAAAKKSGQSQIGLEEPYKPPSFVAVDDNPLLKDDEVMFLLKKYLRPDQFSNSKLLKFILHYLECRSTKEAGDFAGLSSPSYWKSRPEVHAVIEAITLKAVQKYGYDASEVIERVKEISALDPIEFENADGSFKTHMSQIAPHARRAIKKFKCKNLYGEDANGIKMVIGQLIEVEVWDKLKASELLGREKNILKETKKVEHDVTERMESILLDSARRADDRKALMAREVGLLSGGQSERDTKENRVDLSGRGDQTLQVAERGSERDGDITIKDISDGPGGFEGT